MKNKGVFVLNKKEGETPLETLQKFRRKNKINSDIKMTYAGRLDPMAKGLLPVLVGEEVKNKEKYLHLDKEYKFEILFGFATDTYDILGKVLKDTEVKPLYLKKEIKRNLKYFTGKFIQKYPLYSGKTVKGKKLFEYAREGKNVVTPNKEVFVKKLKFIKIRKISGATLLQNIEKRIKKVKGDFRQKEILKIWRKNLSVKNVKHRVFNIGVFEIKCSSGTYVRGIANSLGERISLPALAFSIERTKVGKWVKISV